jgi:enoyl-CoA hydratase/isomerase-like protein
MSNEQWQHQHHLIEDMFEALWNFPVPTVAAVEGFAYAGGCELALGTDFIVASETAEFAVKEITRGIMPSGGGIHRLAHSIGVRRASELIYTGRAIKADQACEWGLVNRVVPPNRALATALEIANEIVASAPMAIRAAKVVIEFPNPPQLSHCLIGPTQKTGVDPLIRCLQVRETQRCTPAMALGVTDHIWTIAELVAAALESDTPPPLPRPTSDMTLRPAPPRLRLIVGRGGKGANKPR